MSAALLSSPEAAAPVFEPATAAHRSRISSIDALRGLVMIIMLLDHLRETFYLHFQVTDPMTLPGTAPEVFFSRFAAHFCAPAFVFLAGLSAWLYANPPSGAPRPVRGFLLKRGLLLLALEFTVVSFAWSGSYNVIYLQVIWAIGVSMAVLGLLSGLPRWSLAALGLLIVFGHNAFSGMVVAPGSPWYLPWTLALHRGWAVAEGAIKVRLTYPALPWVGVILLGYCCGPVFGTSGARAQRCRWLQRAGLTCLAMLLVLRGFNLYGENAPWTHGGSPLLTAMAWLNFTKYPPSLDFLLLTLGVAMISLAALETTKNALTRVLSTFGSAPMFFYIVHLYFLLVAYKVPLAAFGTNQGTRFGVDRDAFWIVWCLWLALVPLFYFPVRAFARYKQRTKRGWVKYF